MAANKPWPTLEFDGEAAPALLCPAWRELTWATGLGGNPPAYSLRRSLNFSGPFDDTTQIGTTNSSTLTFTDTLANGLVNGTTYYYVVHGISNLGGKGLDSVAVSARS